MRGRKTRRVCRGFTGLLLLSALLWLSVGTAFAAGEIVRTQEILLDANGGIFAGKWYIEESTTRRVKFEIYSDGSHSFINTDLWPEWEGKGQLGWSTTKNGKEEYDTQRFRKIGYEGGYSLGELVPLDGSVQTLYAVWTDVYEITLDANGGNFGTNTDKYGHVTPIETQNGKFWRDSFGGMGRTGINGEPKKEGDVVLKGWSADKSAKKPEYSTGFGGLKLNASTPKTLYAVYGKPGDAASDYVDPDEVIPISKAKISGLTTMTWTGKKLTPAVTVTVGKTKLKKGTDYTLSYQNNVNVGTATVTVTGKGQYTGKVTKKFTIQKAANPLKGKGKTAEVKYSKVKKKDQTLKVSKVLTFTKKGQGTLTYAKSGGNKKITVAKKTGAVTVKKGLKKGKYPVKVKVKAAGNANYKAATQTLTFTVWVK
jgi:hypothetical protein